MAKSVPSQKTKRKTVVVYARTSSKSNAHGSSASRQISSAKRLVHKDTKVQEFKEVISGMLPLQQRQKFMDLINNTGVTKIYVESTRAIARSARVAEEIYEASKKSGVDIVTADIPHLLRHDANPAESFMRRVLFAMTEFERDLIVHRLSEGLRKKRLEEEKKTRGARKVTQKGTAKVNGSHSLLEKKNPTLKQISRAKVIAAQYGKKDFGCRVLAERLSTALYIKPKMSPMAACRMVEEIAVKYKR